MVAYRHGEGKNRFVVRFCVANLRTFCEWVKKKSKEGAPSKTEVTQTRELCGQVKIFLTEVGTFAMMS
jgi:hypothetical protein